uniref:Cytochrome-c oxidase n=1 Tax=Steinernema glaseri TaxID=37863 RepID=A0A1I7YCQ8_9BILA
MPWNAPLSSVLLLGVLGALIAPGTPIVCYSCANDFIVWSGTAILIGVGDVRLMSSAERSPGNQNVHL